MEVLYELVEQLGVACSSHWGQSRRAHQQQSSQRDNDGKDAHLLSLLPDRPPRTRRSKPTAAKLERVDTAHSRRPSLQEAANERASLYSVFFLSASVPMLCIRCDTGQVMDINSQVMAHSSWTPCDLLGRRFIAPFSLIASRKYRTLEEIAAAEAALSCLGHERVLVPARGRHVHQKVFAQYEASEELERRLYAGELSVIRAVWRFQMRAGQLHEATVTQWCEQWEDVPDGEGGTRRQPTYALYVISAESITRVE